MEKFTKNHITMFVFILLGLAFSGYLAGVKLFSDTCAFGAACPIFLGYPACYTGFIVYSILAIVAVISLFKKELTRNLLVIITGVSFFGVLFSGKLTLGEMSVLFEEGFGAFVKSLPLCSIGLIVFTVIFILSLVVGRGCKDPCCGHCAQELPKEEAKVEPAPAAPEVKKEEVIPAFPQIDENKPPELETHVPANTEAAPETPIEIRSDMN